MPRTLPIDVAFSTLLTCLGLVPILTLDLFTILSPQARKHGVFARSQNEPRPKMPLPTVVLAIFAGRKRGKQTDAAGLI